MSPLRIGVVGAGYAQATHLPVYAALAEEGLVEVTAVATGHRATAEAAARRFGTARAYVGFEALSADSDVDLVDVATRPSRHRAMVESALAAGKHVLCEAPLAPSVADGEALLAAAGAAGRIGLVDMQSRFWPGLTELRTRVRAGWVGRVDNISATAFYPTFTTEAAVRSSAWCAAAENGASSLRVHGLHTADIVRWVFGELTDVRGAAVRREPAWAGPDGPVPADSADSAAWTARTADGALCSVHSSWIARFGAGWRLVVHGSEGMLLAEADGHTGHFPVRLRGARGDDAAPRELVAPVGSPTQPFEALVRRAVEHLGSGTAAPLPSDLATFADGVAVLRIAAVVEH